MKAAQILKQKIDRNALTVGAMATFHLWPGLLEIAINAGLDYLIIDMEHFTHSHPMVADICAAARRADFPIIIRPPAAEMTPLRLAMDLGPCGLLIPYIESAQVLDLVRDAVYLKPRGKRRPGGPGNRWISSFNYPDWKKEVEDDLIILPQIESRLGLEHVDEIAGHPLTTAIAVGPYDLSADLGVCWQGDHPRLVEALATIRNAGRAAGKNMWMIGSADALRKSGFTFMCIAEPIALLESSLTAAVSNARRGAAVAAGPQAPLP